MNDEIIEIVGIATNTIKYPLDFQEETDRESSNKNIRLIITSTILYVKEMTNNIADVDGAEDGAKDDADGMKVGSATQTSISIGE